MIQAELIMGRVVKSAEAWHTSARQFFSIQDILNGSTVTARNYNLEVRILAPKKELKGTEQGGNREPTKLADRPFIRPLTVNSELEKQPQLKMVSNGKIPTSRV